jgi:serine/threonine protein kinase
MPQDRYGRYNILRPLGQGGMAAVYLAEDPVLRRAVAVKVLRGDLGTQPDWVRRFHDEATAIARLGNPHVVQVFDFGREAAEDYLVMEFVEGISLSELLGAKGGRLDVLTAVAIACQAAEGLRAAHEAGIIHRDIKPDNLLIRRDGTVKIADFGIARIMEEVSRTMTGSVFGSPLFMAPEQIEGKNPSGAIDLFALAGVLFRCCTGRHPYEAEHAHAVMWRIVQEDAPRLAESMPGVLPELDTLVAAMHSRDPSGRPRAGEAARLLRQILVHAGVPDPLEAVASKLPDKVREIAPVAVAPAKKSIPMPPQPRHGFLTKHPRVVPLALSGIALISAAYLAGLAWDRMQLDTIPELSRVDDPALRRDSSSSPDGSPLPQEGASKVVGASRATAPSNAELSGVRVETPVASPSREPARQATESVSTTAASSASVASGIDVLVRDEAPEDKGAIKPRIALVNRTNARIDWIRLRWSLEFPATNVVAEAYYAPKCEARIEGQGTTGDLVVTCSDLGLKPGQTWPGPDGMSLAVHTPEWKPWRNKEALGLDRKMRTRSDIRVEAR